MRSATSMLSLVAGLSLLGAANEVIAQMPGLFAQSQAPTGKNLIAQTVGNLGLTGLLVLISGIILFIGACLIVIRSRRPAVIASCLVFLPLPLLIAVIGVLKGCVVSFDVLAMSDATVEQSKLFAALAEALLPPLAALVITMPSYLVLSVGLFIRILGSEEEPAMGGKQWLTVKWIQRDESI